jgi:hypothetical protein
MAFLDVNRLPVNDRGEVWNNGAMVGMMPAGGGMPGGGGGGGVSRADLARAIICS